MPESSAKKARHSSRRHSRDTIRAMSYAPKHPEGARKKAVAHGAGSGPSKGRSGRPRRNSSTRPMRSNSKTKKMTVNPSTRKHHSVPDVAPDTLRIIPIGGVEEIGKNMTVIEYGEDIIIVDAGFQFSEDETPGVDFLLPNTTYLAERKEKIRGLFITHGHFDHIGAIPYIMEGIANPTIYTREFGSLIIQKRQMEYPHVPALDIKVVQGDERMKIGKHFHVSFFPISHAIPDSMGIIIETPVGDIAFIEDVRVDHIEGIPTPAEEEHYARFKGKKMLLMTLDSTSVSKPGFSLPESQALAGIEQIMKDTPGRLIIGTFSSQVERVMAMIEMARKYNKKVVVDGRSMKGNVEIVRQLELIKLDNIVPIEDIDTLKDKEVVVIATGAQGEEYSVFDRIANKTHKFIRLKPSDTVLFSSSVIPGNERSIAKLKDNLYRQEARIVTYTDADVHASGHGSRGELEWIHKQIDYQHFMPLHGHHYMLRIHAELAQSLGTPKERILIPDNGTIVEFSNGGKTMTRRKEKAPSDAVMVDGFSIGDMQEAVIRDRQMLAEEGMFIVVVSINPKTGKLRKSPDIISRGFIYLRESQTLLNETRNLIKKTAEDTTRGMNPINFDHVKGAVTDTVRRHLFQKTGKSPIVIPVVIGV